MEVELNMAEQMDRLQIFYRLVVQTVSIFSKLLEGGNVCGYVEVDTDGVRTFFTWQFHVSGEIQLPFEGWVAMLVLFAKRERPLSALATLEAALYLLLC